MKKAHKDRIQNIFIINPSAGRKLTGMLEDDIRALWETAGQDYEIYETKSPGDGEAFVRQRCQEFATKTRNDGPVPETPVSSEPVSVSDTVEPATTHDADPALRFYACGGDGTLNEVVNGSYGFEFVEVGCIPMGTGNDFIRNFPDADFLDMMAQFRGRAVPCDLIRYETSPVGEYGTRCCVNMINIGFDCSVVDTTELLKKLPLMSGSIAYLGGVAVNLIKKKGADLSVAYPDGFIHDGKLLLLSIANGCFCGGGIKGLPRAKTDDGLMDVSLVKNVSRGTFIKLFPKYQKGTHLEDPRIDNILRYSQETSLKVSPSSSNREGSIMICVDGEIFRANSVALSMKSSAFRFIIPD